MLPRRYLATVFRKLRNTPRNSLAPHRNRAKSTTPHMISDEFRFKLLVKLGSLIFKQYPFKWSQLDWLRNPWFSGYLQKFGEERGLNRERRWILQELIRLVETVPGDTAECGAFEGAGSYLICHANAANSNFNRVHHVFDSFEGLSTPAAVDGAYWHKGDMSRGEDIVRKNLTEFSAYELHKGWIPERFVDVKEKHFAFVHIDVDLYQPTLDSMSFFYERMNPGGIIVCDDYGFTTCPGATRAVNETLRDKPEKMIALPDGGGFLIKGISTSSRGALDT